MTNFRLIPVLFFTSLALVSCGSDSTSSPDTDPVPTSVEGTFVKGLVTGASCELFEVTDAGAAGDSLATGSTIDGLVDFGEGIEYQGTALIECTGGTYTDEATGSTLTAPLIRAVVNVVENAADNSFVVSPLTEIATQLAGNNLDSAVTLNSEIATAFGLDGEDITTLMPTDLNTEAAGDDAAGVYGSVLALISQLDNDSSESLEEVLEDLSDDLADGELSDANTQSLNDAAVNLETSAVAENVNSDVIDDIQDVIGNIDISPTDSAPTISLLVTSPLSAPFGEEVNLSSLIQVSDAEDDNESLDLDIEVSVGGGSLPNGIDFLAPGTYDIQYTVTDSANQTDTVELEVEVGDPQIRLVGESNLSVSPLNAFIDPGAEIINSEMEVIVSAFGGSVPAPLADDPPLTDGNYQVSYLYAYTLADGTAQQLDIIRFVSVENQAPEITLAATEIEVPFGASLSDFGLDDLLAYPTFSDVEDDALEIPLEPSVLVEVGDSEQALNSFAPGVYDITYSVTDSSENLTVETVVVTVTGPSIELNGFEVVTIKPEDDFIDEGANVTNSDMDVVNTVFAEPPLDLENGVIGEYELSYSFGCTQADGEDCSLEVVRTVIVTPLLVDLKVLTRVNGVSPETVYFSAQDSRPVNDEDCVDFNGNTGDSDPDVLIACSSGQYFGYHFNFDDPDSGSFEYSEALPEGDIPNSKNTQVSASPRAIHTFVCEGAGNSRWNGTDACEYNVGVRVQEPDGDFADAFIQVSIQPQDVAYSLDDTYCVAADADFSECPTDNSSNHLTDSPSPGEFDGARILYKRRTLETDTTVYSDACIDYSEAGVTIDAFGSGAFDPVVESAQIGVDDNCGDLLAETDELMTYPQLAKDSDGYITQGWAYDVTVTNLRLGTINGGVASTLVTLHNLDLDWSDEPAVPAYTGQIRFARASDQCEDDPNIDCDFVQYPYSIFVSDTIAMGTTAPAPVNNLSNNEQDALLPRLNIGCLNACGLINSGVIGLEVKTANEHNLRVMGSWGLVISNSWFRGGHVGGTGPNARITLRQMNTGSLTSQTADPENFIDGNAAGDGPGFIRPENPGTNGFAPSYNFVIDSWIDDPSQEPEHDSSPFVGFESGQQFSGTFGLKIYTNLDGESNTNQLFLGGRNTVALDTDFNDYNINCRIDDNVNHPDDTFWYDRSTIFAVGSSSGNCQGSISGGSLPPSPDAPVSLEP